MPLEAGEPVLAGDIAETRGDDGTISAGDAVAIDTNGDLTQADTEANELAGVANEGLNLGLGGVYVANAAAGVSDGNKVQAGNTTGTTVGQFIAGGNDGVALSDTGGTWQGMSVPAGYAVIRLK